MRLIDELNVLHASYVESINIAVGHDDIRAAEQLAAQYDDEAITLIAEREGKTHLLPLQRGPVVDTPLRRLVARLGLSHAA